jgi:hypothetical protein
MAILAMLEIDGDTAQLMEAAAEIDRLLPNVDGLLLRMNAPTETGMVLFQLWESAEVRQRNQDDPEHREALQASGMAALLTTTRSRTFDGAELLRVAVAP